MTINSIKRSIRLANQELSELENSPILSGYTGKRMEILTFINRMRKELYKHENQNL